MFPAPFRVVPDANVLYPFTLRDTLLRAAAAGFIQAFWSSQILDEVTRNLVGNGVMDVGRAERLRSAMERAFPEALVTGHETLAGAMNDADEDRHVAAAAVQVGAQVIVTRNLKHFTNLPEGIEAQSPDHFLCKHLDLDPAGMIVLLRDQAGALKRPPRTFEPSPTSDSRSASSSIFSCAAVSHFLSSSARRHPLALPRQLLGPAPAIRWRPEGARDKSPEWRPTTSSLRARHIASRI